MRQRIALLVCFIVILAAVASTAYAQVPVSSGSAGGSGSGSGGTVTSVEIEGFDCTGTTSVNCPENSTVFPTLGGDNTYTGKRIDTPSTAQSITAVSDAIVCGRVNVQVSAGGAYTLTSAPTIANGTEGQVCRITNTGSNAITLQDQDTLASSNLQLNSSTVALAAGEVIELHYVNGDWREQKGAVSTTSISESVYLPVAGSTNAAAHAFTSGFGAGTGTTNGAGINAVTGAGWRLAFATFPVDTTNIIYLSGQYRLPATWVSGSGLNVDLHWFPSSGGASGNIVKWGVATACIATGEAFTPGPTFNTADPVDGTLGASPDTKMVVTSVALTTTGCAAGESLFFRIQRNSTTGNGDTLALTANLHAVTLRFTRTAQ